jgi:hypothetical protein
MKTVSLNWQEEKMLTYKEEKFEAVLKILAVFAVACSAILLFPQARDFMAGLGGRILGRTFVLDNDALAKEMMTFIISIISGLGAFLIISAKDLQGFLDKHGKKIFIYGSVLIIAISIIVRIIMYIKCRSLWADEAYLASSVVGRKWLELLILPNNQTVPILYAFAVKAIGSVLGYSEFSVRIYSMFAFIGFLICEAILLKYAFDLNIYKILSVVVISALLPGYIWYSNEFKPYMGDVFFVVLTILLYLFYQKKKLRLPALTVFYILFLGFSSPSVFFIGGALSCEFLAAVYRKNKKQILSVSASAVVIAAVFVLHYIWWMAPAAELVKDWWRGESGETGTIGQILYIFSGVSRRNSDSSFIWLFVPFALAGVYSSVISKNKTAYSVALSLCFAFLASLTGKWPLVGRLWLFLPAIVLIFTPIGFDFIVKSNKAMGKIGLKVMSGIIIYLLANCLSYTVGDKMYLYKQEVNPLIAYVQKNIKEDGKLYVYEGAEDGVRFKNGYKAAKIGNVTADNIIYGKHREEWKQEILGDELRSILGNDKVYLIFSHYPAEIDNGLAVLKLYGTLTEIMNVYYTPLYYFEKSAGKVFSNE